MIHPWPVVSGLDVAWGAVLLLGFVLVLLGVSELRVLRVRVALWWARHVRSPVRRDHWLDQDEMVLLVADTRPGGAVGYREINGARGHVVVWLPSAQSWGDLLEARGAVPVTLHEEGEAC